MIEKTEEGVFLDRLTKDGQPAGDTWHTTIDEAKEQALKEYGELLGSWRRVPDTLVNDEQLIAFALGGDATGD